MIDKESILGNFNSVYNSCVSKITVSEMNDLSLKMRSAYVNTVNEHIQLFRINPELFIEISTKLDHYIKIAGESLTNYVKKIRQMQ